MTESRTGPPRESPQPAGAPAPADDEQVDPDAMAEAHEYIEPGWRQSSFDLAYGLDVIDADDTVPGDLLDDLFPKPAK